MARPFKSAGRHACNCLIPSRHAISISCQKPQTTASALFRPHSTIQVIPEVTPEASALFLNNSTSGLYARWRYLVYPILADRELLVLRFGFLYRGGGLYCQNTVNQAAIFEKSGPARMWAASKIPFPVLVSFPSRAFKRHAQFHGSF